MSVNLFDEVGYVQGLRASLTDLYQKPDDEQTKAEINNLIQQIRNYEEKWKRFFGVYIKPDRKFPEKYGVRSEF